MDSDYSDSYFYQDVGFNFNYEGDFMLLGVFAIYDSGISTWMPPIYARNKGEMLRQFMDACNDASSRLAKHPSDYTLFELGTFNDDSWGISATFSVASIIFSVLCKKISI